MLKYLVILAIGVLVYQLMGGGVRIAGVYMHPFITLAMIVVAFQAFFLMQDN